MQPEAHFRAFGIWQNNVHRKLQVIGIERECENLRSGAGQFMELDEVELAGMEDLVPEGLGAVSEDGVTAKIPALCRLLCTHKKTAGIRFPKMYKGKNDQVSDSAFLFSVLWWSLTRAALSGSVHCCSKDRSQQGSFILCLYSFGCAKASSVCSGVPSAEAWGRTRACMTSAPSTTSHRHSQSAKSVLISYTCFARVSATPVCMCQVCEMSHQSTAKGSISRSLGAWSCRRKRMQFNWDTSNFQRTRPEFLLLDDVDLFGAFSNTDNESRRKARNGLFRCVREKWCILTLHSTPTADRDAHERVHDLVFLPGILETMWCRVPQFNVANQNLGLC